ncbi:MAG TPA: ABC transporter substrate-binding protein [Chitinophagaceae bacterium]|nr:ABC transporter substrate-binding protein [Chitinophagaceae bacterium]
MVNRFRECLMMCLIILLTCCRAIAQTDSTQLITTTTGTVQPLRIAVLAPIYIDSVFTGTDYTGGNILPNYVLPGLDFYNGAMMAVDSLQKENVPVEVWVYDTRKSYENTTMLEAEMDDKNFSLIIAYLSGALEQQQLAAFAFSHNIPFISGTYPNDAGVSGNPYFAIVNSTLKTHVQGIYNYVQHNYIGDKVYYITKKGGMEQRIKNYFDAMKARSYPLQYTYVELPDNFTDADLLSKIDSNSESVIVCGSLNVDFGTRLLKTINNSGAAKVFTVVGMPTWDDMDGLYDEDCKNVNIVFSTPYNYNRSDKLIAGLSDEYRSKFNGRPTDMMFKGFDQVYHFTHLLLRYHDSLFSHLSDTSFKISTVYNFQPVRLKSTSFVPDFLENKKLYFVKMVGGSIKAVN